MKALYCLALLLLASASLVLALEPPPGGGYPSQTTALGDDALSNVTTGDLCTSLGYETLYNDTTGGENVAVGVQALYSNTTGGANVAIGNYALFNNISGTYNMAIGEQALAGNTNGNGNVAMGWTALSSCTTGIQNSAIGFGAMSLSTTASYNTAFGADALSFDSTGSYNTALGRGAMNMGTGSDNVAVGYGAGAAITGSTNVLVGYNAGLTVTTGSNNIEIGNQGAKKDNALIRIGAAGTQKQTFIAGISNATISGGAAVMVNSSGQLGVATSSARFKENIAPMDKASDALLDLKPVTFRYKKELDPAAIPQFGLVAEEVAKVDPDLVIRDEAGKPYTVRYEAVNAMLLNEFLKEHRKVEEQTRVNAQQESEIAELRAALKAQGEQIQKVSAQVQGREQPLLATQN